MWVAKFNLKHDCILGNRCEKFGVMMQSFDVSGSKQVKGNKVTTSHIHQLIGDPLSIKKFVADLKKDKRVDYLEFSGNTLFMITTMKKSPVYYFSKEIFYVKPMVINNLGVEHYELGSHKKEVLMKYIAAVKPGTESFQLFSLTKKSMDKIYFPKVMPKITDLQKKALELAIKEGYYEVPKKTNLRELAKLSKVALATYQKHLQKAESKIIPDLLSFLK